MGNDKRSRFSWPAWSASLAVHATGAILILVAGFHIVTPEGTVTDKTEFEAVDTNTAAPAAPAVPAPPVPNEPVEAPVAAAPAPVAPEAKEDSQPVSEDSPPVDEAPPKPVVTQPDEEAPPIPTEESPEVAKADSDPAQEPESTPAAAPEPVAPVQQTAATPSAAPAEIPQGDGSDGVPQYGTPGTTIDETKLMEAFGNHKPEYPWMARLRRQQGTVILRAFIKKDGSVDQTAIEKSSGFPLIDTEAIRTYARWRYQPGLTGWVLKPFKFSLK